jgi:glutamine synthetase
MEQASTNLEFKPTDASCNPYLAFGALIAAGLDGLERELEAPEPLAVDPATLRDREREAAGAYRYPTTLEASIRSLERDQALIEALGELLARSYLAVRRSEWEAYSAMPEDERFRAHFLKY